MKQDGIWGDNLMLKAAADHYQTTICVISSESRKHDYTISPEKDSNSKHLVLGHVCELHYVSLRPTPGIRLLTNIITIASVEKMKLAVR